LSKIKHPFKPSALRPIVGEFRLPHARTGGVLIVAQRRLSTLRHNILRGSAKPPTSMGESHCIRDRERVTIHTCRGGGLHPLYSTHQLIFAALAAAAMAARLLALQLSFSPLSCTHSCSLSQLCFLKSCLFYRHLWCCSTCSAVKHGCKVRHGRLPNH